MARGSWCAVRGGSGWHDVGEVAVPQMPGYGRLEP
jgi:hypothetical protein